LGGVRATWGIKIASGDVGSKCRPAAGAYKNAPAGLSPPMSKIEYKSSPSFLPPLSSKTPPPQHAAAKQHMCQWARSCALKGRK